MTNRESFMVPETVKDNRHLEFKEAFGDLRRLLKRERVNRSNTFPTPLF